jgi:hypothetical protein
MDSIQSSSTNIVRFEKEIGIKTNNDSTRNNKFESISPPLADDLNGRANLITETSINKIPHSSRSLTISSPNIVQLPTEHSKQPSLKSTTLFNYQKRDNL